MNVVWDAHFVVHNMITWLCNLKISKSIRSYIVAVVQDGIRAEKRYRLIMLSALLEIYEDSQLSFCSKFKRGVFSQTNLCSVAITFVILNKYYYTDNRSRNQLQNNAQCLWQYWYINYQTVMKKRLAGLTSNLGAANFSLICLVKSMPR